MARALGALVAATLLMTLVPAAGAQARTYPTVPAALFGMHYHAIGRQPVDFRAGAIRLWDSGVAWAAMEPSRGAIDWTRLDRAVADARAAGVREIQYVFGHTPRWAAADLTVPGPIGNGSSSRPKRMSYFFDFVRAVATRYKGRITSYEIWNEASLTIYFRGTAADLATMTIGASKIIRSVDPKASVIAPSTTYGVFNRRPTFWREYVTRLRSAGWPIDAFNIHPYVKAPDYLLKREELIRTVTAYYRGFGFRGPIWDTEVNFGDRRNLDPSWTQIVYTGNQAAGMVARAYIDAMRLKVPRVFWYGWDNHILGIDMIDPVTKEVTPAGVAFQRLQGWMVGRQWRGCTDTALKVRSCMLRTQYGMRTRLVYSTTIQPRTYVFPAGTTSYRTLAGAVVRVKPGQRIPITKVPIYVVGA